MQREVIEVDDVNVALIELAIASLLRSLTTPGPLHLVAFEREYEVMEMVCDIARQGNRQVVMQTQTRFASLAIHVQPCDGVDFLVRLPFGEQDLNCFDRRGFKR